MYTNSYALFCTIQVNLYEKRHACDDLPAYEHAQRNIALTR